MRIRNAVALLAALASAACIDFVDPMFPPAGAVIFSASVHLLAGDTASVQSHLIPGANAQHLWREVSPDTLRINGAALHSSNIQADNQRDYSGVVIIDASHTGFVRIQPPTVVGVTPPAVVLLPIVQQADPDTVRFRFSAPFLLHVRVPATFASDSAKVSRSWVMEITDGNKAFRLGGDGAPPATITVPPEYQPLGQPGTSSATLFVFESRRVDQPSGDYIGAYALDTRVRWIVRTFAN